MLRGEVRKAMNKDNGLPPKEAEKEQEQESNADEGLIFKAAVKKAIRTVPIEPSEGEGDAPEYVCRDKILEAIDNLLAMAIVDLESPVRLERAIEKAKAWDTLAEYAETQTPVCGMDGEKIMVFKAKLKACMDELCPGEGT